jgi:hypothetical protein
MNSSSSPTPSVWVAAVVKYIFFLKIFEDSKLQNEQLFSAHSVSMGSGCSKVQKLPGTSKTLTPEGARAPVVNKNKLIPARQTRTP